MFNPEMMSHRLPITCTLLILLPYLALTQKMDREQIAAAARAQFEPALTELRAFLAMPNDGHYEERVRTNLQWCQEAFGKRQFTTKILPTEGAPLLFAERIYHPLGKNVLFYLQIDGQPVDPSKWQQPDPFQAVLKQQNEAGEWEIIDWDQPDDSFDPDWRIFARSASDSKGPGMAFIAALDIIQAQKIQPDFNIKVIMDFQEEMGSPTLPAAVEKYRDLLQAEMILIMDGTRHVSNLPTLNFGARGIATITIRVFGARGDLHSGQYGNFAPNPVFGLSKLLAGMKDDDGRVIISGFYEGIHLSEKEKTAINDIPEDLAEIKETLGIAREEKVGQTYQESLQYPSLNVRGLRAAWVGKEVRTLIPAEAVAEIDLRLVPESDGLRLVNLIKDYILENGYHLVDSIPTEEERMNFAKLASFHYRLGSKPFRTDIGSPIGQWLSQAMERTFNAGGYVRMRTTGGSQPIEPFITTLGIPAVSIRIPNPDNSIHAPNENLRLGNFLEGIQMCLGVLTEPWE